MSAQSTKNARPSCAPQSKITLCLILLLIGLLVMAGTAMAQLPIPASTQFDITGFIQDATLDSSCAANAHCGGTITVNGHVIVVPKETIVMFPANALTWQEIFAQAPAPYGFLTNPPSTGMAMSDLPAPMSTYEAQVIGNRVISGGGDSYIAGLIYISQHALNAGSGFINFIDYSRGEMRVGGLLGNSATGARVRINDPVGRYGRVNSPDIRFTVDPDNPTIMAATGFPMCFPRVVADPAIAGNPDDPLCPRTQRPVDAAGTFVSTIQTLDPVALPGVPPDPTIQIPFEVGDWVSFAGTLVNDSATPTAGPWPGAASTYISAHTINNNVAVYTWPGTNPAYIMIDTTLIGTGGLTVIGAGEAVVRTRFEGMMTDVNEGAQRVAHLYGIDFSPADGSTSDRDYGTIGVDPGPPNGAVKGRWRFRPPCLPFGSVPTRPDKDCVMNAAGSFLPPPREVRAVIQGAWVPGQTTTYANGIIAGQYHAPISEYIFPENIPGAPIVENNFNSIPFLAQGGYTSTAGTLVGQLNPWPSNIVPAPFCAPPTASAGGPYSTGSGGTIMLNGSSGGTGPFTYAWTASAGTFDNASVASPNFTAPQTAVGTTVNLSFTATNSCGTSTATSTVAVSAALAPAVNPIPSQAVDSGSGGSFAVSGSDPNNPPSVPLTWSVSQSGSLALLNLAINSTGATTANVTFTAPSGVTTATDVTVTVMATNAAGVFSAPVSTTVTINPAVACNAPVANAGGPYTAASGGSITLNGSATGSTPISFLWTAPAQGTISPLNSATTTYTAPVTGVPLDVNVSLTASNSCAGSPNTATSTVHVNAALPPVVTPPAATSVPATTTDVALLVTATDPNVPALTPLIFNVTQAPAGTLLFPSAGCTGVVQGNLCVTQVTPTSVRVTFNAPATPATVTLTFTATNTAGVVSAPATTTVTVTDLFSITAAEYRIGKQRLIVNVTDQTIDPTIQIFLNPYRCEVDAAPCAPNAQGIWMYNPDPAAGGVGNLFTGGAGGLYVIDVVGAPKPACNRNGNYATPCSIASISARSSKGGTATSVLTRIRL